jgi:hypothetical protein
MKMQLNEVMQLNHEVEQLLKLKLPVTAKFYLLELKRDLKKEVEKFRELDRILIEEYGVVNGQTIQVPKTDESGAVHPSWIEYVNKLNEVLAIEKNIKFPEKLRLSMFEGIDTELSLETFLSHLTE